MGHALTSARYKHCSSQWQEKCLCDLAWVCVLGLKLQGRVPILKDNGAFFLQGITLGLSTPLPSLILAIPIVECLSSCARVWVSTRARGGCGKQKFQSKGGRTEEYHEERMGMCPWSRGSDCSNCQKVHLSPEALSGSALQLVLRKSFKKWEKCWILPSLVRVSGLGTCWAGHCMWTVMVIFCRNTVRVPATLLVLEWFHRRVSLLSKTWGKEAEIIFAEILLLIPPWWHKILRVQFSCLIQALKA